MHTTEAMCRAGCTTRRGVRFWEEQGLLGEVARSEGGNRLYTDEQITRARIIAAAQFGGWKLEEIKEMVETYDYEVADAIATRLADQAAAAASLIENLPAVLRTQEYDI